MLLTYRTFLWLTSEDNGPHLGCYGDKYADTPNLDGLAKKGMIYTRAISNAPRLCSCQNYDYFRHVPTLNRGGAYEEHDQIAKGL